MSSRELADLSVEPSGIQHLTDEQKERLTQVLDDYLRALENGVPSDPSELLAANPDLAEPLQLYLDSLNELHLVAAGFDDRTPRAASALDIEPSATDEKRLGDFILGKEIGRGGMGVVYEARQISLGRRVALKVLPFAAVLDSKQIARFKNEAQAAAQLHHPNIVPVFAVGAERGVHYYAMQLIDGQPLDRAIEQLRRVREQRSFGGKRAPDAAPLDSTMSYIADRSFLTAKSTNRREYYSAVLRLGIQAAEALHAAHEFGVVHRDIKPSNLLLDGSGKLWVTDFGLARCQSNATLTRTGDVVGTMRYMSPEQAMGRTALVDHRTDVYSLGATIYELLALRPAFPDENGQSLARRIEDQEPPRLRTIDAGIPQDLETVVAKSMSKVRDERYATSQQFADDLSRVLEGKPTIAKPPTFLERATRWTRRHGRFAAAAFGLAVAASLVLAVGTVLIAREKIKADQNFARAERNFQDARGAVDQLGAQLAEQLASVPGADQVRRKLLEDTLVYYEKFAREAGNDPSLCADLATTYSKIGTLRDATGRRTEGLKDHQKAVELFRRLVAEQPSSSDFRRRLAMCQNNLGMALNRLGRTDEASKAYLEAIAAQEKLLAETPANSGVLSDLSVYRNNLALLQTQTGAADVAEKSFAQAIRQQQQQAETHPADVEAQRSLAALFHNQAALFGIKDPERAAALYAKALEQRQKVATAEPDVPQHQSELALTYGNLAAVQSSLGQPEEAAASLQEALAIQQRLVRQSPDQVSYRAELAVTCNNSGLASSKAGKASEAEGSFAKALELQKQLVAEHPDDIGMQSTLGGIYNNLGMVYEKLKRFDEAANSYSSAIEHQRIAFQQAGEVARYREFLSKHYYNLGRVRRELGQGNEAAQAALERKQLWQRDPARLVAVAEELALASSLLAREKNGQLPAEHCASLAVEALQEAVGQGHRLPADLFWQESFAGLKNHAGFAKLVGR